jgi:hypothetical protein
VPGVIAASTSAWSYGGSILSFLFPMILFLVVATSLYVVFTKPSVVPGHGEPTVARPIGWTPVVRMPSEGSRAAAPQNPAARPPNPEAAE